MNIDYYVCRHVMTIDLYTWSIIRILCNDNYVCRHEITIRVLQFLSLLCTDNYVCRHEITTELYTCSVQCSDNYVCRHEMTIDNYVCRHEMTIDNYVFRHEITTEWYTCSFLRIPCIENYEDENDDSLECFKPICGWWQPWVLKETLYLRMTAVKLQEKLFEWMKTVENILQILQMYTNNTSTEAVFV